MDATWNTNKFVSTPSKDLKYGTQQRWYMVYVISTF